MNRRARTSRSRSPPRPRNIVSNGYQIVFRPSSSLLPELVRSFQPDFIASQGDESIAVEVRSLAALRNDEQIRQYAALFRTLPGWRLDLVVIPDDPPPLSKPRFLSKESSRKRFHAAEALATDLGDVEGALILLWTTIEASLRLEIGTDDHVPMMTGARLIKEALSLGLITQKEWKTLDQLANVRNQVAHGEEPPRVTKIMYKGARTIATRLIGNVS